MPPCGYHIGQQVQSHRMFKIGGIEIDDVVGSPRRDQIEDFLSEIAVRIQDGDAVTGFDILCDQTFQETRFSRARLADKICVLHAVGQPKAEGLLPSPNVPFADANEMILRLQ